MVNDPEIRDKMRDKENAICYEMQVVDIAGRRNCLVICGIADYTDSHKDTKWKAYAGATAAAVAREHLYVRAPGTVEALKPTGTFWSHTSLLTVSSG
jgi:hypothetical protein